MRQVGYRNRGKLVVRMIPTGVETRIRLGDLFDILPGWS